MWTCSKLRYQHPLPVESMGSRAVHIMDEFISGSLRFVFVFLKPGQGLSRCLTLAVRQLRTASNRKGRLVLQSSIVTTPAD